MLIYSIFYVIFIRIGPGTIKAWKKFIWHMWTTMDFCILYLLLLLISGKNSRENFFLETFPGKWLSRKKVWEMDFSRKRIWEIWFSRKKVWEGKFVSREKIFEKGNFSNKLLKKKSLRNRFLKKKSSYQTPGRSFKIK